MFFLDLNYNIEGAREHSNGLCPSNIFILIRRCHINYDYDNYDNYDNMQGVLITHCNIVYPSKHIFLHCKQFSVVSFNGTTSAWLSYSL